MDGGKVPHGRGMRKKGEERRRGAFRWSEQVIQVLSSRSSVAEKESRTNGKIRKKKDDLRDRKDSA